LAASAPDTPAELQWIVSKALRKDARERYQTARELLSDLKQLSRGREAASESPRRSRARAIALALGMLALSAAALVWLRRAGRSAAAPEAPVGATFAQLTDEAGPESFPSLAPDGRTLVYVSAAAGNRDIYLQRVGGRNPVNLTADNPSDDTQPAFSPDGTLLAFRSERDGGGIFLMGATGESVRRVSDVGYNPAWSPDGRRLVVASESVTQPSSRPTRSQLWIVELASGAAKSLGDADALQPRWSPHGERIAYWGRPGDGVHGDVWTVPSGGGEAVPLTQDPAMDWNPEWSHDGRYLYFSSDRDGTMNIWRVAVDEASGRPQGHPQPITLGSATSNQHLSLARDGRHLAYVAQEDTRNLRRVAFDPAGERAVGAPFALTRGSLRAGFPDPSPDGEWVAFHSTGRQADVFLVRADGSGLRQLTDDMHRDQWPRWSPDGARIAFTSYRGGASEVWSIERDGSGLQQLTHQPGAHYASWSPDGSRLAYSTHRPSGGAFVFGLDEQRVLLSLEQPPDPARADEPWSWSRDGRRLAMLRHLADGEHGGVGVYDLETRSYDWLNDYGDFPVWLADGRRLLFVHGGKILLVDRVTRRQREVLASGGEELGSPALSRDNRTLYFTHVATEGDVWLATLR
jgi:Tol biopolymer transport system component